MLAKSDAARLEVVIGELRPQFRETLLLRDFQGLEYREIARVTDVLIGTVMSRLARARGRLIAILAEDTALRLLTPTRSWWSTAIRQRD